MSLATDSLRASSAISAFLCGAGCQKRVWTYATQDRLKATPLAMYMAVATQLQQPTGHSPTGQRFTPVQGPQIHPFNPLRPGSLNKIKIKLYAPILNLLQRVILFPNMRKKGPLPKAHAVRNGRSKRVGKDNRMNFPEIICMVLCFNLNLKLKHSL